MDVSATGGMGDLAARMAEAVSRAKAGGAAGVSAMGPTRAAGQGDFIDSLGSALKAVSNAQTRSTTLQKEFQLENPAVSLEDTMIAMNKAQLAFGAAVQTRNKLVQAYEQIMSMPV